MRFFASFRMTGTFDIGEPNLYGGEGKINMLSLNRQANKLPL